MKLTNLFTALASICFIYIIAQPFWNHSTAAVNSAIFFVIGWLAASFGAKLNN